MVKRKKTVGTPSLNEDPKMTSSQAGFRIRLKKMVNQENIHVLVCYDACLAILLFLHALLSFSLDGIESEDFYAKSSLYLFVITGYLPLSPQPRIGSRLFFLSFSSPFPVIPDAALTGTGPCATEIR